MQPAGLGQRPTLVNTQRPIILRHPCYVTVAGHRAAAASQPAGCYRPTACGRTDRPEITAAKVWAYLQTFLEKCHYFRNDGPYRHKTQHVLHMVGTRLRAKFCRRMMRRLGGDRPQTK